MNEWLTLVASRLVNRILFTLHAVFTLMPERIANHLIIQQNRTCRLTVSVEKALNVSRWHNVINKHMHIYDNVFAFSQVSAGFSSWLRSCWFIKTAAFLLQMSENRASDWKTWVIRTCTCSNPDLFITVMSSDFCIHCLNDQSEK